MRRALWVMALAACVPPPLTLEDGALDGSTSDGSAFDGGTSDGGASKYRAAILADSPIHYWRLGEASGTTASDEVTTGAAAGTYVGSFLLGQPGAIDKDPDTAVGLNLGGESSGCVETATSSEVDFSGTQPFSFEAWIKPTIVDGNYRRLFYREDTNKANGMSLFVNNVQGITLQRISGGSITATGTGGNVSTTSFTHVVGVYDGAHVFIYTNGAFVSQQPDTSSVAAVSTPLAVGCAPGVAATYFEGIVDEVAVYAYALSAGQIAQHYAAGHS